MDNVLDWYRAGGPFGVAQVVVALASLALLAERATYLLKRTSVNARPFMEHVLTLTRNGRVDEALALCAEHHAALPDLGLVIIRSRESPAGDLMQVAEAAKRSFVPTLRRRLSWLVALGVLALLIGVAGAVFELQGASPEGTVLRPLGAGVLTAIPLVVGHAILSNHVRTVSDHLEEFSIRLINTLAGRPDVRLGHRDR